MSDEPLIAPDVSGVSLRESKRFGRTAVAARAFAPGDVVIAEAPAVKIRPVNVLAPIQHICATLRIPLQFFESFLGVIDDPTMTSERVEEVFSSLHSPLRATTLEGLHPQEVRATKMLFSRECFEQCVPPTCSSFDFWNGLRNAGDDGVLRYITIHHACRVNVHDCRSCAGIYLQCAKLAHSCNPNTWWFMQQDDSVVHIASRAIAEGEVLSFSYLGTGLDLLSATMARREQIKQLSFFCNCSRCEAFERDGETCRMLQCPICTATYMRSPNFNGGYPTARRPLKLRCATGGWYCEDCRALVPYEAVRESISQEHVVQTAVMKLFFGKKCSYEDERLLRHSMVLRGISSSGNALQQQWILCGLVKQRLSAEHFLYVVCTHALLRSVVIAIEGSRKGTTSDFLMLVQTLRARVPAFTFASEFSEHLELSNRWFEQHMNGSPQHVKLLALASEAFTLLLSPRYTSESGEYLLEFDERRMLDSFFPMWEEIARKWVPCMAYKDYKYMFANPKDTLSVS